MNPLTEAQIRAAFVNCSKGEAKRLPVPRDLADQPWDDLDFLGWRDPRGGERAYLAAPLPGQLSAVVLRCPSGPVGQSRRSMCAICLTTRSGGVSLMVAPKAGEAGKLGNSVGTYLCDDLACSLYLRGRRTTPGPRLPESISLQDRIDRTVANLAAFIASVTG